MATSRTAGREYTVVGWCTNRSLLADQEALKKVLRNICEHIDMRPLEEMGVDVERQIEKLGLEKFHDEGGSTASLILSTSHASIHGWPWRDESRSDGAMFWCTVGSCRDFEPIRVDEILHEHLGVTYASRYENVPLLPEREGPKFTDALDRAMQ